MRFTKALKQGFLNELRETANVSRSARAIGIAPWTAYDHKKKDEKFSIDWENAIQEACDCMEEECRRRAVDGVEKPIFYQGEQCGAVREYSDTLLIFLLKAHRPEKFRDSHRLELTGKDGGPIKSKNEQPLDLKKLSIAELEQLEMLMEKAQPDE